MERWSITVCSPLYNIDIYIYQIKNYDKSTQKLKLDIFQFRTSTRISKKKIRSSVLFIVYYSSCRDAVVILYYIYTYISCCFLILLLVHLPTAASAETSSELGHCEIIEILVEFSKNLWNFWNSEMTKF